MTSVDRLTQPYSFEPTATAAELAAEYGELDPGSETGREVTIAGRLMLRRVQGKLAFGTLQDPTGRIQLFAPSQHTPDFEHFCGLSLGDWVGVTGEVMTTKRGELSVKVGDWVRLAETRRSFPDKWHGMTDPDLRYRQRYVDLWVTDEARRTFIMRSKIMSMIRRFLEDQGYIEVETPPPHSVTSTIRSTWQAGRSSSTILIIARIALRMFRIQPTITPFPDSARATSSVAAIRSRISPVC